MVLLLLAVIWAAFLLPPILRARAEHRPHGSIVDFRRQLHVLARTAPPSGVRTVPLVSATGPAPVARGPVSRVAPRRRRSAAKRRRDVLFGLLAVMAGSLVLGFIPQLRVLWAVHLVADVLFVAYIALLIYLRNLAAEREMKVRFLPSASPAEPALLLRRSGS